MMLDDSTVPGYSAGYIRCIRSEFVPTDESPYVSAAGDDYVFGGHWALGLAVRITDRAASYGSGSNPIPTVNLPHIMESQRPNQGCTRNDITHYCSNGLVNCCSDWRAMPAGFWI
jgi:hypothetical protein